LQEKFRFGSNPDINSIKAAGVIKLINEGIKKEKIIE